MVEGIPAYWMNETSGVLRPVIMAYLHGEPLSADQIITMCAYLRLWINAPAWRGPNIEALRGRVASLQSRADIKRWLDDALREGIDPL